MAKIVKYCTPCEEGFAEKFGFCPNCGSALTAFEMKPMVVEPIADATPSVVDNTPIASSFVEETIETKAETILPTPIVDAPILDVPQIEAAIPTPIEAAPIIETAPTTNVFGFDDTKETIFEEELFSDEKVSHEEPITESFAAASVSPIIQPTEVPTVLGKKTEKVTTDEYLEKESSGYVRISANSEYRPTFVEDRNGGTRSALLLGAMVLVLSVALGGWLYSLFARQLDVAGLEDQVFVVGPQIDIAPELQKEQEQLEKDKDKGGGGGGGGKENEKDDVSKGQMARQNEKPDFTPSATMVRLTDPDLKINATTQGPPRKQNIDPNERYGSKTGQTSSISDGLGGGNGMGGGNGPGQGTGNGSGNGNGNGSGSGNGVGNGIGNFKGNGTGDDNDPPPLKTPTPKPKAPAVTTAMKILFQPKPGYTDAARQAQIQGAVILKVTFSANGSIGNVAVVRGLPNGLTEQAIAAAKNIRFTPAMEDGVPKATQRTMQFSFSIY